MKLLLKKLLSPRRMEYLEVDRHLIILETFQGVKRFADCPDEVKKGKDVRLGFPELVGIEKILIAILEGKQPSFELKSIARSSGPNSPLYFDLYVINHQDEENFERKLLIFFEDVTERMVLEQTLVQRTNEATLLYNALAASKDYIDKIITSMADALLVTTRTGMIKTVNKATQDLLGYSEEELIKKPISIIVNNLEFLQESRKLIHSKSKERSLQDVEVVCHHKNGNKIIVAFSCSVINTDINTHLYDSKDLVYIGRDITARKQAQEALEFARHQAELASQTKSSFLANMSHEIRTPMNAIIGMTSLLSDTSLTPEQRDFVETIRSSGEALLVLINEILDLSKLEAQEMELEILDFDVSICIEEVMELLAPTAHAKGLEMTALIPQQIPTQLQGDRTRLRQILINLVGNAIKFTEKGEVIVAVELTEESAKTATLQFVIQDTGIGIAPEDQSKLFKPFSQVDPSTTRQYGGTGLGLAICQQLVTLMQGKISVKSQSNQGSEFFITLPFKKQKPAVTSGENPEIFQGKRLLVVDDHASSRKGISYQATSWGIEVIEAEGATTAWKALEQMSNLGQNYDLALIDLDMIEGDGITLGQQIKRNPAFASLLLILLTTHHQLVEAKQALKLGFAAYLVKPIKTSRLFDTILTLLQPPSKNLRSEFTEIENLTRESQTPSTLNLHPPQPLRILVAEDNIVNQKVTLKLLDSLGYDADVATNGQEVLDQLEKISYDVIFMDCQMPILDGYETTQEIRRRQNSRGEDLSKRVCRPVVIAMTANAMKEDQEKCLAAGMDDYLSKPVRKEQLQAILSLWGNRLLQE